MNASALLFRFCFRRTAVALTTFFFTLLDAVRRTRIVLASIGVTSTITTPSLIILQGIGVVVSLVISHNVISNTGDVRNVGTGNGVPDSPESDTVVRLLKALWSDQVTRAQEDCFPGGPKKLRTVPGTSSIPQSTTTGSPGLKVGIVMDPMGRTLERGQSGYPTRPYRSHGHVDRELPARPWGRQ